MTAMDAADLADDQDFREAVRSHVEFGSKVAMQSSAVNIAQRICDLAAPGQVLVSELVKSTSSVRKSRRPRAPTSRRACPSEWRMFAVGARDTPTPRDWGCPKIRRYSLRFLSHIGRYWG